MNVFSKAVVCFLVASPVVARSQAFASITIRPARSNDPPNMRMKVRQNGGLIAHVPVVMLVSYAYDVPVNMSPRFYPLPEWTGRERYDIEAKAPANAVTPGLPYSESHSRMQQMIRQLLADRFGLVVRKEKKKIAVYALSVASSGAKLQKSAIREMDCVFDTESDGCHSFVLGFGHPLNAKAVDIDDLARYISNWTDLPVVNRTGLTGLFTLSTEGWLPMRLPPPPPNTTPDVNRFVGLPTIFTVLGRLGLELHLQEDTLPVYTVDRIEHPAFN